MSIARLQVRRVERRGRGRVLYSVALPCFCSLFFPPLSDGVKGFKGSSAICAKPGHLVTPHAGSRRKGGRPAKPNDMESPYVDLAGQSLAKFIRRGERRVHRSSRLVEKLLRHLRKKAYWQNPGHVTTLACRQPLHGLHTGLCRTPSLLFSPRGGLATGRIGRSMQDNAVEPICRRRWGAEAERVPAPGGFFATGIPGRHCREGRKRGGDGCEEAWLKGEPGEGVRHRKISQRLVVFHAVMGILSG